MLRIKTKEKLMKFTALATVAAYNTALVRCDIFASVQNFLKKLMTSIVNLADVGLPCVVAIDLVMIIFMPGDQKAKAARWAVLVGAIIAYVALRLVNAGELSSTLNTLAS